MTPAETAPCLGKLDAACFKHNPQWARRAFAYRLLHTLFPGFITRRLPRGLRLALIGSLADVPSGLILPPGTVIAPGVTLPPGWQPGDPYPDGWIPAPSSPPDTGPVAPTYLDPFVVGPTPPPGGGPAPAGGIPGSGVYKPAVEEDDGVWGTTTYFSNVSSTIWFGYYFPSAYSTIFVRFPGVDIPQGAQITSAVLTLLAAETNTVGALAAVIKAEDADDAVAPVDYTTAAALVLTTELVGWSPGHWIIETSYDSPDLSDIIQEVVDRSGWSSGNALMLTVADSGVSNDYNNSHSQNALKPSDDPYLSVEWIA